MSAREELIEWVEKAQRLLVETKNPHPGFWYDSVDRQLRYVMAVAKSEWGRVDPSECERGHPLSMGLLAVREFEQDYPELANAIYEVMARFRRLPLSR